MGEQRNLGVLLLKGAIAGAVATFVMGKVTTFLYEHEDPKARREEDEARDGKEAYTVAADKAAAMLGRRLSEEQQERLGLAIHWGLGIGMGALYATLRDRFEEVELGQGLAFGTAFWGVVDEGLNTVLKLTPGPMSFPWQAHGRGLAGHLTFGTVTEGTLKLLDRVM